MMKLRIFMGLWQELRGNFVRYNSNIYYISNFVEMHAGVSTKQFKIYISTISFALATSKFCVFRLSTNSPDGILVRATPIIIP